MILDAYEIFKICQPRHLFDPTRLFHTLEYSNTTEIRLRAKKLKFEPFMVFPRPQTPSQSIRHSKLHDIRYKNCPDWTILKDFRLLEEQVKYDENR